MEKGRWFVQHVKDRGVYPNLMQQKGNKGKKDGSRALDAMVREPLLAQSVMAVEKHK
jgi:hypothetical protein